jgi:hypothetical protein
LRRTLVRWNLKQQAQRGQLQIQNFVQFQNRIIMQQNTYAIAGGREGKSRLNIIATVLQPYTQAWLMNAGITKASNFLVQAVAAEILPYLCQKW